MPHQCVRCGTIYSDDAEEIIKGCSVCGSHVFFYIKPEKYEQMKKLTADLDEKQRRQIEKDILNIIGEENSKDDSPVILDLEAIRILKPGKYEIDLVRLFKGDPLIYKIEDGKYIIDLTETFNSFMKKKGKNKGKK